MGNAAFTLVGLALVACSLDHVVVAALDGASGSSSNGISGSAGNAGNAGNPGRGDNAGSAGEGGSIGLAGSESDAQGGRVLISGGIAGTILIGGDAGASSLLCSCLDNQAVLCGTDGITYYPTGCDDGGTCLPPEIACWHACPCLSGESADLGGSSTWFSIDCDPLSRCPNNFTCLSFTNVETDPQSTCN